MPWVHKLKIRRPALYRHSTCLVHTSTRPALGHSLQLHRPSPSIAQARSRVVLPGGGGSGSGHKSSQLGLSYWMGSSGFTFLSFMWRSHSCHTQSRTPSRVHLCSAKSLLLAAGGCTAPSKQSHGSALYFASTQFAGTQQAPTFHPLAYVWSLAGHVASGPRRQGITAFHDHMQEEKARKKSQEMHLLDVPPRFASWHTGTRAGEVELAFIKASRIRSQARHHRKATRKQQDPCARSVRVA